MLATLFALFVLPLVSASVHGGHHHKVAKRIGTSWYHHQAHPVHNLFRRDAANTDGTEYAAVGTPEWFAGFPSVEGPLVTPDTSKLPQQWVNALNNAVNAGKIPKIPQSTGPSGSVPTYPAGYDPTGQEVCSSTYKTCRNPGDFWDGPDGHFGTGFDDGPTEFTPDLLQFLGDNQEKATHFMIGSQILYYPKQFLQTFSAGEDIAVHTWTHPLMTTKSNLEVVSELGWTMQAIHNSTGGRVPKFWRPPYGDSDNRVRAIAKEVFGLETIIWNQDTEDWTMVNPGGVTKDQVMAEMDKWTSGSKSPGLIVLEHETSQLSVDTFKAVLPMVKSKGWTMTSVVELLDGTSGWANAASTTGQVTPAGILVANTSTTATTPPMASSPASSSNSKSNSTSTSASSQSSVVSTAQNTPSSAGRSRVATSTIILGFFGLLFGVHYAF